jgi:hypothetical protein
MQMLATPDQHRYYSALLFKLGAPNNASAPLSMLERLSRNLLRRIAPRMLIVPEVRHVPAGSGGALMRMALSWRNSLQALADVAGCVAVRRIELHLHPASPRRLPCARRQRLSGAISVA